MVFHGKWYDEVSVGETFGTSLTVTETHLVLCSGMFGDFNPLHVDEEFSKKSMFCSRILHGPFTIALISSPVGMPPRRIRLPRSRRLLAIHLCVCVHGLRTSPPSGAMLLLWIALT